MTSRKRVLAAALVLALASAVSAHGEIGPYVGISAGVAQVDLKPGDVGGVAFRLDDSESAYRLFFGLDLVGPLAVEVGYRDLGTVTDQDGFVTVTSQSDGFDAFAIGSLPLGPVALFAKGGFISWDTALQTRSEGILGGPDIRLDDSGTDFAWGLGVRLELGNFALRGEYEQLELDLPDKVAVVSVGVAYEF
jgi:hypothetical protein